MENFNIMWVHKKNIQGRIVQNGGLGQFADLREGGLAKKKGNALYIISSHQTEFSYTTFFELV